MKVPYGEGLATHTGPESCADRAGNRGSEALTGERAGRLLSREIHAPLEERVPKAGARCGNAARRDLCRGLWVTMIPTATAHVTLLNG